MLTAPRKIRTRMMRTKTGKMKVMMMTTKSTVTDAPEPV